MTPLFFFSATGTRASQKPSNSLSLVAGSLLSYDRCDHHSFIPARSPAPSDSSSSISPTQFLAYRLVAALLLALAISCGKQTPVSSSASILPAAVYSEWAIAQENLAPYVRDRALTVTPDAFRWIEEPGPFPCDLASGPNQCVGTCGPDAPGGPEIRWASGWPQAIRHEGGHCILWALGDPRWSCYEHSAPTDPNFEPACASGVRR